MMYHAEQSDFSTQYISKLVHLKTERMHLREDLQTASLQQGW
jgi:hypothetical protein